MKWFYDEFLLSYYDHKLKDKFQRESQVKHAYQHPTESDPEDYDDFRNREDYAAYKLKRGLRTLDSEYQFSEIPNIKQEPAKDKPVFYGKPIPTTLYREEVV